MPRLLWFALGAIAGTAYASRVIEVARIGNAPVAGPTEVPSAKSLRQRLADGLEEGAIRISGLIEERAHGFADQLRNGEVEEPAPYPPIAPTAVQSSARPVVGATAAWAKPEAHTLPGEHQTPVATVHTANNLPVFEPDATPKDVLESPFVQTDPSKPAQKIL